MTKRHDNNADVDLYTPLELLYMYICEEYIILLDGNKVLDSSYTNFICVFLDED